MAGIYIHIPYCKSICHYCDFYSIKDPGSHEDFINALLKEAVRRKDYLSGETVSTIYFGGGTPSVLNIRELERIIVMLYDNYRIENDCEITIELNPDDINYNYLVGLKKTGFNRLSYGIQSWNDNILKMLNRRHNSSQSEIAIRDSFKAGFINISVDLIYGIPGYSSEEWSRNLDLTTGYDIKHISAYHLTIEPGTEFGKRKKKGLLMEIDEEESNDQFNILVEKTEKAGFIQYEISNFGKEGWFSRHNSNYWRQVSYLGLGPSAHSFNQISRQWNVSDVNKYINSIRKNKIFYYKEQLDIRKRFNEYIMTSLRTIWGIDTEFVEQNFGKEGYDYIINISGKFIDYGLMQLQGHKLILTNPGKMISDNIISEFMVTDNSRTK